jgi:hypothetical protein
MLLIIIRRASTTKGNTSGIMMRMEDDDDCDEQDVSPKKAKIAGVFDESCQFCNSPTNFHRCIHCNITVCVLDDLHSIGLPDDPMMRICNSCVANAK